MDKVKRERGTNFNLEERDILVSSVLKYQDVIENKQSDATTWKKKEHTWEIIEKEFNAQSGGAYRSSKTLRIKYEGLKRSIRKKSAAIRDELYRTGGGTSTATLLDPVEEQIKSMIALSTDGMDSCYDSDLLTQPLTVSQETHESKDGLNNVSMEEFILIQPTETDIVSDVIQENAITPNEKAESENEKYVPTPSTSSFKKWDVTSRRFLKTRKHPALATANSHMNPFDVLARAKLELVQLQKSLVEAEIKEKQKEWDFKEKERQWKEEEYKLRIQKLHKELNE